MSTLNERAIKRGQLLERIDQQRALLEMSCAPITDKLNALDRIIDSTEKSRQWIAENPLAVGVGIFVLILWRPKGAFKIISKGLIGWRTLRLLRQKLGPFLA